MSNSRRHLLGLCCVAIASACGGELAPTSATEGPSVAIAVAPLSLPGITDAQWRLTVSTATATVWTRELTSRAYGDGAGSLSYVGPCDADAGANTVTLELLALYQGAAGTTPVDPTSYDNPGPLSRTVTCLRDADVPVNFDVTLARAATQGFFDVAVTFDDLFCSAKLDCEQPDGSDILLLADASGARRPTVVLGFACTADTAADDTVLYLDPITLSCGAGAHLATVDPSAGPGNLATGAGLTQSASAPVLFGAAVYRGEEALGGVGKIYWNLALGLALGTAPAQSCTLTARGTASSGPLAGNATALGATYPFVSWSVPVTSAAGALTCTQHPLNGGNGVATTYSNPNAPQPFAFSFNGATALPFQTTLVGARTMADPARWSDGTFATSCDAYRHPPESYAYTGAVGDGLYRVDPDGAGPGAPLTVRCDMATDGGGWTLLLRDAWDNTLVPKGLAALPAQNSAGTPDGALDYVGPWSTYAGPYLYRRADVGGDNAFISHQSFGLQLTEFDIPDGPTHTYDEPLVTLGGATVMADADPTHRLNFFFRNTEQSWGPCGALATGRDTAGNCWNNFFGSSYWENLPGGNQVIISQAGHIAELWTRAAAATAPPPGTPIVGALTTADPGRWQDGSTAASCRDYRYPATGRAYSGSTGDGFYRVDPDGGGSTPAQVVRCDMATAGGGWTLILRDNWDSALVPRGQTSLPAQNSAGIASGSLDYVGPWQSFTGDYLYKRTDTTGDRMFISHQNFGLTQTPATVTTTPGLTWDQPLVTLAGRSIVRADQTTAHRLNFLFRYGSPECGAVSTGRDNGPASNCWNNLFGSSYWDNLPGGNIMVYNTAGHVVELWVRATAPSNPPADLHAAAVVLDLRSSAAHGTTTFVDLSPSAHPITAAGQVHHSTATSPDGDSSIAFDGDGDTLTIAPSADFAFGTGNFTVEFWMRLSGTPRRQYAVAFGRSNTAGNLLFDFEDTDNGGHSLWFYWNGTGYPRIVDGAVGKYSDGVWHHFALVRSGTTLTAWVDGASVGAVSETAAIGSASEPLTVGALTDFPGWDFGGHLDRVRVTKGVARYTAPFVP